MILTWTFGVPLSECSEFRAKVAQGLRRVWDDARNTGAGNIETIVPLHCTASQLCDMQPVTEPPEPQSSGLFHRKVICPAYPHELS